MNKMLKISDEMMLNIRAIKSKHGYTNDSEAIRALIIAGINKMQPEYTKAQARPSLPIQADPIDEARMLCTGYLGGKLTDSNGNAMAMGNYCVFTKYEVLPGAVKKVIAVEEKQPLSQLEGEKPYKYRGGTKHEIEEIIRDPEKIIYN